MPVRVVFLLDKYPVGVYDANEIGMSVWGKVDRKAIYRLKGGTPMREEVYDISGMHCAACSASVEKVTRRLPGVERSDVNLVAERMTIVYDETQVTPEQIIAKVEKAGFGAKLHQETQEAAPVQTGEDPEELELRRKKRELIVSAIFSCALLYVSMGQMLPFGLPALPLPDLFSMQTHPMNFAVLQLMLAIPVLYCGRNFFINGFQALFHGNPNMDSLVAIGSACSFVYSVVMMFLITDDVHGHVHNLFYESSAVVLREYGYTGDIIIIENGTEMRPVRSEDKQAAIEKFHIDAANPIFLFVGQINWKKGILRLLEAAAYLKQRGEKFTVVLAGQGPDEEAVKAKANELNVAEHVLFTGHLSDTHLLDGLYQAATLFTFPSQYDTFSLVIREAAAMYTPSVAIEGTAPAEPIVHGQNGLVCADDGEKLGELLLKYMHDTEALTRMGRAAHDTIPRDWDSILVKVRERYAALVARKDEAKMTERHAKLKDTLLERYEKLAAYFGIKL